MKTDAAKILAKEMETKSVEKNEEESKITVGEASLAAPFSFLRPCIDGSEFILRSGVAAAAFSLTSYRSIALNSLMACFNLATLYRNGFRYGKYMWNVELSFIMVRLFCNYVSRFSFETNPTLLSFRRLTKVRMRSAARPDRD